MISIYETSDFGEALVIRAKLEQAGFLVHLDNYNWGSAEPYMGYSQGYRLWVSATEEDEVKAFLNEPASESEKPPEPEADTTDEAERTSAAHKSESLAESYDPIDECPLCGAHEISRFRSLFWFPVFFVIGMYILPAGGNRRVCRACQHRYKENRPAITGPMKFVLLLWAVYAVALYATEGGWTPTLKMPLITH